MKYIFELNKKREHIVEILDNKFSPTRITIDEGDKVWFTWTKDKVHFKIQRNFHENEKNEKKLF